MKQEINDFINPSLNMNDDNNYKQYSYQQKYSHQSSFKNGKYKDIYNFNVKECDNCVCKLYKLKNPKKTNRNNEGQIENKLFDLNPKIDGFYNAFDEFKENEKYNPYINYKEKYNK